MSQMVRHILKTLQQMLQDRIYKFKKTKSITFENRTLSHT